MYTLLDIVVFAFFCTSAMEVVNYMPADDYLMCEFGKREMYAAFEYDMAQYNAFMLENGAAVDKARITMLNAYLNSGKVTVKADKMPEVGP